VEAGESGRAALEEERERLRALADAREESLAAERDRVAELTCQIRSAESRTDSQSQRASMRDEEVSRLRVRCCLPPLPASLHLSQPPPARCDFARADLRK